MVELIGKTQDAFIQVGTVEATAVDQYLIESVANAQPRLSVDRDLHRHLKICVPIDIQKVIPASAYDRRRRRILENEIDESITAARNDEVKFFSITGDQLARLLTRK